MQSRPGFTSCLWMLLCDPEQKGSLPGPPSHLQRAGSGLHVVWLGLRVRSQRLPLIPSLSCVPAEQQLENLWAGSPGQKQVPLRAGRDDTAGTCSSPVAESPVLCLPCISTAVQMQFPASGCCSFSETANYSKQRKPFIKCILCVHLAAPRGGAHFEVTSSHQSTVPCVGSS